MSIKQVLISLGALSLSLSAYAASTDASSQKTGVKTVKKAKISSITFEACCDEHYGDSEACHKLNHVTHKSKKVNGKNVKKECYEDEEDAYLIGE